LRLQKVLSDLISADQVAYVKGINIFDAVRTIGDNLDHTKLSNLPGLIIAIAFEKAFDYLSWNFLLKTWRKFNFGEFFIKWVRSFYTDISSCIMNKGVTTRPFQFVGGRDGEILSRPI